MLNSAKRLLCAGHSQLPFGREIPEHGSDQQERRHVANQVTYLVSSCVACTAMMPACTILDQTVNEIRLRCSAGFRAAAIR